MAYKLAVLEIWRDFFVLAYIVCPLPIIESVDSICRDSADTQYMLIQTNFSKSPKRLTYKPLQHPIVHFRVFSWRFSFFFFFRWASSNLRDSFMMVFAQNSSLFHWAVYQSIAFFKFEVTPWGDSNCSLKNYGFLYDAIFLHVYVCAQITLCKIAELEILLVCWESLKKAWDSSANTA